MPQQLDKTTPDVDLDHPYANHDQMNLTTALNEFIADYLDRSSDLFELEDKLAAIVMEHIEPLEEIFRRTQKHTEFRAAIFSMFAHTDDDFEIRQYERNNEDDDV